MYILKNKLLHKTPFHLLKVFSVFKNLARINFNLEILLLTMNTLQAYSEPSQTFKINLFVKIIKS